MLVHVIGQGAAYEVEFLTQDGHTVCVETLQPEDPASAPLSAMREDARQDLLRSEESRKKPRLRDQSREPTTASSSLAMMACEGCQSPSVSE